MQIQILKSYAVIPFIAGLFFGQLQKTEPKVFICNNGKTTKYHLKNDCKGLSRCTHRIIEMALEDAKKNGMTLCGFEK